MTQKHRRKGIALAKVDGDQIIVLMNDRLKAIELGTKSEAAEPGRGLHLGITS